MVRNQFSTGVGDELYGATFTLGALQNALESNGGWLKLRWLQYLRRFIPAYVSEKPVTSSTRFAILLPKNQTLDRAPQAFIDQLRPFFDPATPQWFAARPWLGDSSLSVNPENIDQALAGEVSGYRRFFWRDEDVSGDDPI